MSVGSVDRNAQINEARSAKESYEDRERDLIQRHKRELAGIQRKHVKTIDGLKKQFNDDLNSVRDTTRETLTNKEIQHLKEIQDVQDVSRQRIINTKRDDDEKFNMATSTLKDEVERYKDKGETDQARLHKQFYKNISDKEDGEKETEVRTRTASQQALRSQADRMKDRFEEERKYYRTYISDRNKSNDQEKTRLMRGNKEELDRVNKRMDYQQESLESKYADSLKYEADNYNNSVNDMEDGFKQALVENKEKFLAKTQNMDDDNAAGFKDFSSKVNNRMENEVASVKRENLDLKHKNALDNLNERHMREKEKKDMLIAFKANIDESDRRNALSVQDAQKQKSHQIKEILRKQDKDVQMANVKFVNEIDEVKAREEIHRMEEVGEVARDRDLSKINSERQKKRLFENYSDRTLSQTEFYDDALDAKKREFEKNIGSQRVMYEKQKADDVANLRGQLAKESASHQEKLMDTMTNYEKQLNTMKADYEKKLKRQAELNREQIDKQVKSIEMEREVQEAKLNARLNQQKETYERELEQLRKRQAAERQELVLKKAT